MARINGCTKSPSSDLLTQWRAQFNNEDEAVATAAWVANRLVKDKAKSTRRKFYSLKGEWLRRNQDNLIEGRISREERAGCCVGATAPAGNPATSATSAVRALTARSAAEPAA